MGRDKARMIVGDKMLFESAMSVMREVCSGSIFLVGRDRQGFVGAETEIGTLLDLQIDSTDLPRCADRGTLHGVSARDDAVDSGSRLRYAIRHGGSNEKTCKLLLRRS